MIPQLLTKRGPKVQISFWSEEYRARSLKKVKNYISINPLTPSPHICVGWENPEFQAVQ